jgi:23S rRNA pseudouridine1911/1915/1917 synthase
VVEQIELTVPGDLAGSRLDKAIAQLLGVSRGQASRLLAGEVTVDGRPAQASDRVAASQLIVCQDPGSTESLTPEPVPFDVLFEDSHLMVVDKPPGVVVHPGAARTSGTLAAGLIHQYPELVGVGAEGRWGLVHRLDKDTSGVLVVARTQPAFESLSGQLRRREMVRVYTTLVEGRMEAATGTIEAPIARDPARPTMQATVPGGRHARTHYEVMTHNEASDVSLLSVRLETGRTHQIRVHMASIGHPVVGDWAYGARRRELSPPRIFLHARSLVFTHPVTGDRIDVEAPLPADLSGFLAGLAH